MRGLRLGPGLGPRRTLGGAPAPAYSPLTALTASVLLAWWDASAAGTLWQDAGVTPAGSTDPVGQWDDASGNGNHLSMTGSVRPVRSGTTLTFSGAQKITRATITQGAKAQPYTIAAVARSTANSTSFWDNGTSTTRNLLQRGAAATTAVLFAGATVTATGQPDLSVRRAIVAEYNGASSAVRVNDGTPFSGNGGTNQLGSVNLGGNASNLLQGELDEVLLIGRLLTAQERADLHAYFVSKWSV